MAKDIWINILGDSSKLTGALGQAGSQVDKFAERVGKIGRAMTVVGGAVTAAFGAIVLKTMKLGDTYDKMAKRTNVSVEALSALGYAAKISGADLDTVEKSLRYMARGMNDAAQGVGESLEAFKYLNIEVLDTEGNLRGTVDVLKEAATKLAAMTDETKQVALATELFGARYGTQLLPMLKEGGAGIEALMEKAKELGVVMSTEAAAKAAEFNDRLTDLKESIGAAGRGIGEILIPPLTKLAEKAIEIIKKIKDWADAHKPLVEIIIKVGATLGVLAAIGGPILMAVSAFMKMKVAITAISIAMKALYISSGPIGWLILAAGALYLAWTTNFGGIQDFTLKVVDGIKKVLGWLWDKVLWLGEKLGLFKKDITEDFSEVNQKIAISADGVSDSVGKAATAIDGVKESVGEAIEPTDNFATASKTLADNLGEVAEKAEEASEKIKLYAEDVAGNYIELSVKATESWDAFYEFWGTKAKETAEVVEATIEKVAKKMYKVLDEAGNVIGLTNIQQVSPGETLVPITSPTPGTSTINNIPLNQLTIPATKGNVYSPTVQVTVQGNGNASEIKKVVKEALDESARQYGRSGFELVT